MAEDDRTHVRLMMDYSAATPLWDEWGHADGDEWDLSDELRRDLAAFAERWEANVSPATFDDRFDGRPMLRRLNTLRCSIVDGVTGRARQRVTEARAIGREGERLRDRLAEELGPDVVVTYVP